MKKKVLRWRLGNLPTAQDVDRLFMDGIIDKEEAREILFTQEEKEDRDKKSLKEEIKFLRDLVERLSDRQETIKIIETIKEPYDPKPWYKPYEIWCGSGTSTSITDNSVMYLTAESSSFNDIKTF